MPIPRHSVALPRVELRGDSPRTAGVTELRVHGVGGTPPDAILGDLAPEQVMRRRDRGLLPGARTIAPVARARSRAGTWTGTWRSFSWGGLTSRSKIRVLWLALLPFLFANLARLDVPGRNPRVGVAVPRSSGWPPGCAHWR